MNIGALKAKTEASQAAQLAAWNCLLKSLPPGASPLYEAFKGNEVSAAIFEIWLDAYHVWARCAKEEQDAADASCPSCGEIVDDGQERCVECRMVFVREEGF